jgi:hypothetical protein
MYGKLAITCFKYQVYLYSSEAISYLNAFLWVGTEPTLWVIRLPPPPTTGSPPPLCMAALPSPIWKTTLVWLHYHTYIKKHGENLYGLGTMTCKTTTVSLNYVCKIGLMYCAYSIMNISYYKVLNTESVSSRNIPN